LQTIAVATESKKKHNKLEIYGPPGMYNFIASSISLSGAELKHLKVEVFELHGGSNRSGRPSYVRKFSEFSQRGLFLRKIPQNDDGTWTISQATEITTREQAEQFSRGETRSLKISAAEVDHVPRMQCFGYVIQEPTTQPRTLDHERALELGVHSGMKYRHLKSGFSVMSDDDEDREVRPEEVLVGPALMPRKFTLIGDCCAIPAPMVELSRDSDVLIHEATFSVNDKGPKVDYGGHSSAQQAGRFADHVNAKVLLLNHLNPTANCLAGQQLLVDEAAREIQNSKTRIQLCYDHLEVVVPRSGFKLDRN
jgi:ribonuclease Z